MRPHIRTSFSVIVVLAIATVLWFRAELRQNSKETAADPLQRVVATDSVFAQPVDSLIAETRLVDFEGWLSSYRAGERGSAFIQTGVALAESRRPVMLSLIRNDSERALKRAIGYADYASLPAQIRSWVEEPFSVTGDVQVTAICDHDHHTPEHHVDVYLEDSTRLRIDDEYAPRTGLSKLDVPLQGIRMDGWAALDANVFKVVEGKDADWAVETLLPGNPDPNVDFLTGEELGGAALIAVAGGFYFQFSNDETLGRLEAEVRGYDNLPGKYTGSSVVFSSEVQELGAKGFPIELIRESQNQISVNETTGDKTSIFIRVVFTDKPNAPLSKADLESQINTEVSERLKDFSYDQTSMTATASANTYTLGATADYTFNGTGGTKDNQDMIDEAISLYEAAGSPDGALGNFDVVGIIFPKLDSWGSTAGLGTVGGANSKHWLNGVPSTETILHEFGHNYGLNHSNYWVFDDTNPASVDPVDPTGANEEYGDLWDVMGDGDANRAHFHMAAKRYLGWLASDQVERIDAAGSYTRRVFRFDHKNSTGLQGLEIRKANNENYWVGFRRGFESNANYYRGAYILWERPPSGTDRNQGWIIDTTPESEGERQDGGISLGRTYSDTAAGVHITPIAVGGNASNEYLDVVVNYGAFAGNNAPTVTLNPILEGEARTALSFSASGNDVDGDSLVYSWDLGNGEVYPSTSTISPTFTVGGTYQVSVTVSDMKGGTETKSAQVVITDPVNTWASRNSNTGNNLESLASNSTHIVAGGRGIILRSSDGITWEDVSPTGLGFLGNMIIEGICWTGSEFIAAGAEFISGVGQYTILSSPDGSSWTRELIEPLPSAPGFPRGLNSVASNADGSKVIAVGADGGVFVRIDDGDWTKVDIGLVDDDTLGGIAYGNGVFVVGGRNNGAGQELLLFRTNDGTNWEDLKDNSDLMPWWGLDAVDFYNGFFVGSGFFSRTAFSENGGLSWQSLEQGNTNQVESFAFGGGVYYALGKDLDNGSALINLVSSNGKIWRLVQSGAQSGNDVHYFNNSFIIVGDGGKILQSGLVQASAEILAAPQIEPASQDFTGSVSVTMSTNSEGAEIRYTLDDSEPTASSTLYDSAIAISNTTTVKAKVFKGDLDPSMTSIATYTKLLSGFDSWIAGFNVGDDTDASDNPDGDWAKNLLEWAVGSLPNSSDSATVAPVLSFDGSGKAVFTISRFSKSSDVTLTVEKSTDLKTWELLETTATIDSDTQLVLISNSTVSEYPCFLRIKAKD